MKCQKPAARDHNELQEQDVHHGDRRAPGEGLSLFEVGVISLLCARAVTCQYMYTAVSVRLSRQDLVSFSAVGRNATGGQDSVDITMFTLTCNIELFINGALARLQRRMSE